MGVKGKVLMGKDMIKVRMGHEKDRLVGLVVSVSDY